MFGLGMFEIMIILAVALIFIGPAKLPELAKNIGKGLREFQRAKQGLMDQIQAEPEQAPQEAESVKAQSDGPSIEAEFDKSEDLSKDNNEVLVDENELHLQDNHLDYEEVAQEDEKQEDDDVGDLGEENPNAKKNKSV